MHQMQNGGAGSNSAAGNAGSARNRVVDASTVLRSQSVSQHPGGEDSLGPMRTYSHGTEIQMMRSYSHSTEINPSDTL